MRHSKSVSIYAVIITLIFLFSLMVPSVLATEFHIIKGTLYIDEAVAGAGIDIELEVLGDTFPIETFEQDENGYNFYSPGFEDATYGGETVYFTVIYDGTSYIPIDNASIVFNKNTDPVEVYIIDLHVYLPVNSPPDKPSLIAPEDGSTVDSTDSATLEVQVTDPDEDPMDVYFHDASDDSLIGTVTDVASGGTASVLWEGLSPDTEYIWYAIAKDSEYETKSDVWSFRTKINQPPDKPSLIAPEDGSTVDSTDSATLEVQVTDPDEDPMDVYFYNASNDSPIGTDTDVASGGTASIVWGGLSPDTEYIWYAIAKDSEYETKSDTWSFTTNKAENKKPKVCITKPQRGLYIFNRLILPRFLRPALIIGTITIKANATDEDSGIEKVEFFINGKSIGEDTTEPYTCNWTKDRIRLFHIFVIKVVATDNDGATAEDQMIVRKFL